jgi:putative transposase
VIRGMGGVAHAVGVADHVHVFAGLRATHRLADVMRELKSDTSFWIHKELRWPQFAWQEGCGGFTVSASHIEAVRKYVLRQEEHHKTKTFQTEYVEMLKRGMVEYEEEYLW